VIFIAYAINEPKTIMPVKATPYQHQRAAFAFVCGLFGLPKGGDADCANLRIKSSGAALLCEMGTG
jgi:hypothetical protein